MPPDQETSDPAGWSDDDLLATAVANFGVGADAGLSNDLRFRVGVVRVIRNRLQYVANTAEARPAIFFLLPTGPPDVSTSWSPMLDNGLTEIEGRFWFVGPQAASGHAIALDHWPDDATVFGTATTQLAVGDVPAILFETRTAVPSARYFPHGLSEPECYEHLRLSGADITIDEAISVVDRVYKQSLVTPTVQLAPGKVWDKPSNHIPVPDAESRIQLQLRSGLIGAFPSCVVRSEQSQATGRLDLEIEEPAPAMASGFVRHLLLELKVLRSFRSTGTPVTDRENQDWVSDGINQAAAYGDERGVKARALFCFDMRTEVSDQRCFEHVTKKARQLKVTLRSWHLFATAKSYRTWLTSNAETVSEAA